MFQAAFSIFANEVSLEILHTIWKNIRKKSIKLLQNGGKPINDRRGLVLKFEPLNGKCEGLYLSEYL